jgi:putative ABC transport system ATP-binding protein
MGLLKSAGRAGTTIIMVTHSPVHAAEAQRTIKILDGQVVSETQL